MRDATRWSLRDIVWIVLLAAALLLPVGPTATWLGGAHSATPSDLAGGVWLLKVAIVLLAVTALLMWRLWHPGTSPIPPVGAPAPAGATVALLAIVAAGFALRAYQLNTDLWYDEVLLRVRYAPLEFRQLVSTYDSQNHQPLYSLLARVAMLATGGADWSMRVPAALFGVASLVALWWYGRKVTSPVEATLAALVLAVSYHHLWFSQNARGYTLMLFLTIVATGVMHQLYTAPASPARSVWGYALVMALATYTHLTAALIAIGHAVAIVMVTPWRSRLERNRAVVPGFAILLSGLLSLVLYAPMLPQVFRRLTAPALPGVTLEWTETSWLVGELYRVMSAGVPGGLFTVIIAIGVLGVGVASFWRQSRWTTLLMYVPVVVTLAAVIAARHNLWPRFFFFASGFLVLTAVRGGFVIVRGLLPRYSERVAVAGAVGVALLSLLTLPRAWAPKQQFRAAFEFIQAAREPGDQVVALDAAARIYDLRGWAQEAGWRLAGDLPSVRNVEGTGRRTWIVYTMPARLQALAPDLYEYLAPPRYVTVRVFPATVGGGEIQVLRHDATVEN